MPSLSTYTQSPCRTSTPATLMGISICPGCVLVLFTADSKEEWLHAGIQRCEGYLCASKGASEGQGRSRSQLRALWRCSCVPY